MVTFNVKCKCCPCKSLGIRRIQLTECSSFVCATRAQTIHPVLLRSYPTHSVSESDHECFLWEAARATSAAPLFFESIKSRSGAVFVDGAIEYNNPIARVIREAEEIYHEQEYGCIVSIGTGRIDSKGFDVKKLEGFDVLRTCVEVSMSSSKQAEKFASEKQGKQLLRQKKYFRFDVEQHQHIIQLDEAKKLDLIDATTEAYLGRTDKEEDLIHCARNLSLIDLKASRQSLPAIIYLNQAHFEAQNTYDYMVE